MSKLEALLDNQDALISQCMRWLSRRGAVVTTPQESHEDFVVTMGGSTYEGGTLGEVLAYAVADQVVDNEYMLGIAAKLQASIEAHQADVGAENNLFDMERELEMRRVELERVGDWLESARQDVGAAETWFKFVRDALSGATKGRAA